MRARPVSPYNEAMAVETPARPRRLLFLRPDAALAEAGDRLWNTRPSCSTGRASPPSSAARSRRPTAPAVIDLPGVTLLPGLIDIHVHLIFDASADPIGRAGRTDRRSGARLDGCRRRSGTARRHHDRARPRRPLVPRGARSLPMPARCPCRRSLPPDHPSPPMAGIVTSWVRAHPASTGSGQVWLSTPSAAST